MRAREWGIAVGPLPVGASNAITDVAGVRVGYATLLREPGVRTGVTVVVPFDGAEALCAGFHRLNGNGEMTGTHWIRESGLLTTPIAITNTLSVGAVHEGMIRAWIARAGDGAGPEGWYLPVVAETYDGTLNDILGLHVRPYHVQEAMDDARSGAIAEGNVGGGTGMICHGFKGGTGSSSRVVFIDGMEYTVGVLVQANHGARARLRVNGAPIGQEIGPERVPLPARPSEEQGSIIVIVATDAPLLPGQCERLAQRAALGIGRTGGVGEDSSGDLILAFATGNRNVPEEGHAGETVHAMRMVRGDRMNPLFAAVVDSTEEAILNALLAAESMTGFGGTTVYALDGQMVVDVLKRYGAMESDSV
jgi:D-aminopeptidase